jgi:hypothetical protein
MPDKSQSTRLTLRKKKLLLLKCSRKKTLESLEKLLKEKSEENRLNPGEKKRMKITVQLILKTRKMNEQDQEKINKMKEA